MKHISTLLLFIIATYYCTAQQRHALKQADIVIRHATVITMADSTPLQDRLLCIKNGRITYIGRDKGGNVSTTAKQVDATGQYLMPGLAEMHAHLPADPAELKRFFTLNLMSGVTTIRSMRGKPAHPGYRNNLHYPIPHLYLGAPIITHMMNLTPWRADSLVAAYKQAGYDFIKVIAVKDTASFDNLMDAAKEYGLTICGHVPGNIGIVHAIEKGYNCVEHLDGYIAAAKIGEQNLDAALRLTRDNNVYQCPTLDWYMVALGQLPEEEMLKRTGTEWVPDTTKQQWHEYRAAQYTKMGDSAYNAAKNNYARTHATKLNILCKMVAAGIPLLTGSEGGDDFMVPGFNMIEEMKHMQQAGLSNFAVLKCATVNVAHYMSHIKTEGTIEKGKEANIILLKNNPLEDINAFGTVETVVLNNQVHSAADLQASLN